MALLHGLTTDTERASDLLRSLGYFDRQSKQFEIIQKANPVSPVVVNNEIRYPEIFEGIDVKFTCESLQLKKDVVHSQSTRESLPSPQQLGMSDAGSFLVLALEFDLKPNNIRAFARRADRSKVAVRQADTFTFNGDEPIEFEDEEETQHFFFARDVAYEHHAGATSG